MIIIDLPFDARILLLLLLFYSKVGDPQKA